MPKYLFSVVVYNLLPDDYGENRLKQIEKAIISTIKYFDDGRYLYASDDNTALSFPQDPSVKSPEIPVMVNIRFHNGIRDSVISSVRETIANSLQSAVFKERGDVIVDIVH